MQWEVEQKYRLADSRDLEAKLKTLGAEFQPPIEQTDVYFRHPARDFAQTDEALRLRSVGQEHVITYKGPKIDPNTKTRRELELPLPEGQHTIDQFSELLNALGFAPAGKVVKQRRKASIQWENFEVQCALDNVESVGPFLELEIAADDRSLEFAKKTLTNLAQHLGLGPSERRSYLELLLQSSSNSQHS